MPYMYYDINDVDLADFCDDDLIDELENRGFKIRPENGDNDNDTDELLELYKDYTASGWSGNFKKNIEEFLFSYARNSKQNQ